MLPHLGSSAAGYSLLKFRSHKRGIRRKNHHLHVAEPANDRTKRGKGAPNAGHHGLVRQQHTVVVDMKTGHVSKVANETVGVERAFSGLE